MKWHCSRICCTILSLEKQMIVMQQPLQTSCLLSSRIFTHSCYQTIIVLIFFIKSYMSPLLACTTLESFGKRGSGKCSSRLLPSDAEETIESGIGDVRFTIDKTSMYKFVLIFLPILRQKMAYLIIVYFFPHPPQWIYFGNLWKRFY